MSESTKKLARQRREEIEFDWEQSENKLCGKSQNNWPRELHAGKLE